MAGPLKRYDVTLPNGVVTQMKLNEDDAKRLNATPVEAAASVVEIPEPEAKPQAKARTAANKSRSASNKSGGTGGGG